MTLKRPARSTRTHEPFWYPNARTRLRALLPELALSVVLMTCTTVTIGYSEDVSMALLIAIMALVQMWVQPVLYGCTYLVRDTRAFFVPLALIVLPMPIYIIGWAAFLPVESFGALDFAIPVSVVTGATLFFLTRTRVGLILFAIEALSLGAVFNEMPAAWTVHVVGFAALVTLLVIRSSAARITRNAFVEETLPEEDLADDGNHGRKLGIYAQVVALGAVLGALCLALALGGEILVRRTANMDPTATEQQVATNPSEMPDEELFGDDGSAVEQTESAAPAADHNTNALAGGLAIALLLAVLVLPLPVRLLMRQWARRRLAREPQASDRAAKLYQGIIARLAAVGIERGEAETPSEFVTTHGKELEEVTEALGLDASYWLVLTDAYETARYAGIDPSPDELATCWCIYDALPRYARITYGWRAYLVGPFWRM